MSSSVPGSRRFHALGTGPVPSARLRGFALPPGSPRPAAEIVDDLLAGKYERGRGKIPPAEAAKYDAGDRFIYEVISPPLEEAGLGKLELRGGALHGLETTDGVVRLELIQTSRFGHHVCRAILEAHALRSPSSDTEHVPRAVTEPVSEEFGFVTDAGETRLVQDGGVFHGQRLRPSREALAAFLKRLVAFPYLYDPTSPSGDEGRAVPNPLADRASY